MIDQLKSMAIFVHVVDETSFRGAAKALNISPSIVSLHIKNLEQKIGAPLLYRSTRSLSVTREGLQFYEAAKAMLAAARDGLDLFAQEATTKLTDLRIAIPDTLVANPVFDKISAFAKNHTGIRLTLSSSDVRGNLLKEGHDLAIQMGRLSDSELKSKKIGEDRLITVAAPSYIQKRGEINHPDSLIDLEFISFAAVADKLELRKSGVKPKAYWGVTTVITDSVKSVRKLAVEGLGITSLPYYEAKADLDAERLIEVLPEWENRTLGIYLVWPRNADLSSATREFISFMSAD